MKLYKVTVRIPQYIFKTLHIDNATSKKDAKRKAKAWGCQYETDYDFSGDIATNPSPHNLSVVSVEEEG
jgi:hypothetical protein